MKSFDLGDHAMLAVKLSETSDLGGALCVRWKWGGPCVRGGYPPGFIRRVVYSEGGKSLHRDGDGDARKMPIVRKGPPRHYR